MDGHAILYAYYFTDHPTCTKKEFWRRLRVNKELFMKFLHSVREYTIPTP
jgi:hypothetical protein